MRMRSRERGRGALDIPKKLILKITSKSISVRNEPSRLGLIVCQLQKDYIVKVNEECEVDEVKWLKINSGWICSRDSNGSLCYMPSHEVEASKFWAGESVNRRRVASAISQLLAKGHSLTNARRVATLLLKQSSLYVKNLKPLTNLPDVSIEDLVIALTTANGLKATEIFEFMKVAASQQSDPPKALTDMAMQINDTMNLRPSLWVIQDLGVLDTVDVVMKNDIFVMACARNDIKKFNDCLAKGQELAAIHSELKYTGLHAAADFGAKEIVERLLSAGISSNVRDARHGRTALHFAAQSGRCEIAILLLEKGADRSLADFSGSLPCEIADDQGHAECREILKQIPSEIQYAQVTHCTDKTITIQWVPPVVIPHLHAKVDEFLVIHEPVDKRHGAGQSYSTKQVYLTVEGLLPSTGHSFVVMSHSVSGWSQPSGKLIHFTLPAAPSAPSIVEMIKVTKNGILITWQPPENDNGGLVDLYQLEMTDKDMLQGDYSHTDSGSDIESCTSRTLDSEDNDNNSTASASQLSEDTLGVELTLQNGQLLPRTAAAAAGDGSSAAAAAAAPAAEGVGIGSNLLDGKWHRLIRHRDVSSRSKYVMGLETYHNFYFRAACRNEFGWSPWSSWAGPYTPQEGVQVRQFGDNWIKIGWIEPQLATERGRSVDCYEIQIAMLTGPMSTAIAVYRPKTGAAKGGAKSKGKTGTKATEAELGQGTGAGEGRSHKSVTASGEFKTLSSECKTSEYIARGLRSGKKYQFRARPKINGEWVSWDLCVLSDVITMPSSAPDSPQNVHVIRLLPASLPLSLSLSLSKEQQKEREKEGQGKEEQGKEEQGKEKKLSSLAIKKLSRELGLKTGQHHHLPQSQVQQGQGQGQGQQLGRSESSPSTRPSKMLLQRTGSHLDSESDDGSSVAERAKGGIRGGAGRGGGMGRGRRFGEGNQEEEEEDEEESSEEEEEEGEGDSGGSEEEEDSEGEEGGPEEEGDLVLMTGPLAPEPPQQLEPGAELLITHNSISIEWTNGIPNGSAILECEVQCCKVRDYCIADLERAVAAAGTEEAWDDELTSLYKREGQGQGEGQGEGEREGGLAWKNITGQGVFLSNQSFRAQGLLSGVGYIFRIRQRNDVHWSSFSRATPIITTLLAAPPSAPEVVMISTAHVVIQWQPQQQQQQRGEGTTFLFSALEHSIQIARLDLTVSTEEPVKNQRELLWEEAEYRSCEHTGAGAGLGAGAGVVGSVSRVIIDGLLPMTCYAVRIKIKTVAGWTSWSELSYPFRTLALP